MQTFWVISFIGLLIWTVLSFGIELALVLGTLVSGIVWLIYAFFLKKSSIKDLEKAKEPLSVEYARSFFPIFLIVLILRSFLMEPFRIPSGSMMPTLLVGDFILVNKFAYGLRMPVTKSKFLDIGEPERGDVTVFRFPADTSVDYIKRVVGLPGDKVSYKNKTLHINGEAMSLSINGQYQPVGSGMRAQGSLEGMESLVDVKHSVLINPFVPDYGPRCTFMGDKEITVPDGHYFVMGDNRDDSNDGRCWGFVPEENLVGKAVLIWFSWDWKRPNYIAIDRIGDFIG